MAQETAWRRREGRLRVAIPVAGVAVAVLLSVVAVAVAPERGATNYRVEAELARALLTLAVAALTGAVVTFLVAEHTRAADRRKEDASERRRLVAEMRETHHATKTAQLRIRAHRSVRTYGLEIRDVVLPQVARLGGVLSDVRAHRGGLLSDEDAEAVERLLVVVRSYLQALTTEYERRYLPLSHLQEAEAAWRAGMIKKRIERDQPPAPADVQDLDGHVWSSMVEGENPLPRLRIFLELDPGETEHALSFSAPLREAMDRVEPTR